MTNATATKQHHQASPIRANGKTFPSFQSLLDSYSRNNPGDVVEETNAYTDPETNEANFYTLRIRQGDRKTFRQVSKTSEGWHWKAPDGKAPLFNRKRIAESPNILIVEGEKCVREFTKLGITDFAATTAPGGAAAALKADWSILAGKTCYVWRDFDEPGLRYEQDVIAELRKHDCRILRVRVEELDLDPKQDIADYIDLNEGTNQDKATAVKLVLSDAEPLDVTQALAERFEAIIAGSFRAVPFPQLPELSRLSKAVMPGSVTIVCGDPGAGKSFFVLENAWRWILDQGESVKLLMLEDDDAFHQNRALAQLSGYAELTDTDYVAENPAFAQGQLTQYRHELEKFARHMETTQSQQRTLDEIAQWIETHANNGVRIIIVDPITAAKVSDKPWIDDQRFLFQVKNIVKKTGATLFLTTHPRIGSAGKPSLSGMAGGSSYPRFSDCVLWLKNFDTVQESPILHGSIVRHKQSVEIRKGRNGRGQGMHIAVNLNFNNLCFDEYGIIERSDKNA